MKYTVKIELNDETVKKLKENADHYRMESVEQLLYSLLEVAVGEEVRTTYKTIPLW